LNAFTAIFVLLCLHKLNTLKHIIKASIIAPYGLTTMIWVASGYTAPRFNLDHIVVGFFLPYFYGGWIVSIEMAIICFIGRRYMDGKFPKYSDSETREPNEIFRFIYCAVFLCVLIYYSQVRVFPTKDIYIYHGVLHIFMFIFVLFYWRKLDTLKRIFKACFVLPYGATVIILFVLNLYMGSPFNRGMPFHYMEIIPWLLVAPYYVYGGWIVSMEMLIIFLVGRRYFNGKFPEY
jgi:hypothetical protein